MKSEFTSEKRSVFADGMNWDRAFRVSIKMDGADVPRLAHVGVEHCINKDGNIIVLSKADRSVFHDYIHLLKWDFFPARKEAFIKEAFNAAYGNRSVDWTRIHEWFRLKEATPEMLTAPNTFKAYCENRHDEIMIEWYRDMRGIGLTL